MNGLQVSAMSHVALPAGAERVPAIVVGIDACRCRSDGSHAHFLRSAAAHLRWLAWFGSACVRLGPRALRASQDHYIFVGRLITDKPMPEVTRSIETFRRNFPDWSLFVYGNGPCAKSFEGVPGVSVRSFAQPIEVTEAMRKSTFLILPSRVDHWLLVVYEASLSGCGLVLSGCVGKTPEFMAETAGFVCRAGSASSLIAALHRAAERYETSLDNMWLTARKLGLRCMPENWTGLFREIVRDAVEVLHADANGKVSPV